ncbi:GNAT family N-acetyltransferase [Rhizobiales bacterium RZME27]|uniref:GNAT family N-acetyltransferase n=1 Tax=Endobacterium cereale TaxID=2663029 RepID=A0A6A8A4Q3_9HYPH|nr:GNAT family N-acetyltransferase [Endobacterium cereale]MEB2844862.1 GNAT family N-acetyltransferase [Endobacterium cereale]MQY44777.1 GNAT family N-acetyltransferase [Endobacterium cereale]
MTGRAAVLQASGLTFRQYDLDDAARRAALTALLYDIFGIDITPLDHLGGHDASSMAFGWFDDDDRLIANLSAFTMPTMIDGRSVRAAGLQSGAVRPEFRGRGLFRDVTEKALAWCDAQAFEAVLLYTEKPALYEKHGFVVLPQSRFLAEMPAVGGAGWSARRLDLHQPGDLALTRKMLATRTPVSKHFAVASQSEMFLLNAWLSDDVRLDYLVRLDAIIAWRFNRENTFELLDIVAQDIPALADILSAMGRTPSRVAVDFVPDRLGCGVTTAADDHPLVLMMRGPDNRRPIDPIRLPELAHF